MLTAREALSTNVLKVSHLSRPTQVLRELRAQKITHCMVYGEDEDLLGIVDIRHLVGFSEHRIFSDLLPANQPASVRADAGLDEIGDVLEQSAETCVLVRDGEKPLGLATRESYLSALLRERRASSGDGSGQS